MGIQRLGTTPGRHFRGRPRDWRESWIVGRPLAFESCHEPAISVSLDLSGKIAPLAQARVGILQPRTQGGFQVPTRFRPHLLSAPQATPSRCLFNLAGQSGWARR